MATYDADPGNPASAPKPGELGPGLPSPDANVTSSYTGVEDEAEYDDPDGLLKLADVCERAKSRWEYAKSCDDENRQAHLEDVKFANVRGEQWNADNRKAREAARPARPCLEFNQCGQFVRGVVNDQRQNQAAIKVRPAGGGATKKLADIRAGVIRGIEYQSRASAIYDTALEQAVTGGRGYWRIATEYEREDSIDQVLKLKPIADALNVVLDPDAVEPDKSDARWGFICDWVDKETYEREWPQAQNVVSWDAQGDWGTYVNGDRVCVADYFEVCEYDDTLVETSDGAVMWRADYDAKAAQMMAAMPVNAMLGEALASVMQTMLVPQIVKEHPRKRTRVDYYKLSALPHPLAKYEWHGRFVPIVCIVGDEVVVNGRHYYQGIIRRLRDAQMMYNYWFTLATERIALAPKAPYVGMLGQTENHPEWETANTESHAMLTYDPVKVGDTWYVQPPGRTEAIPIDQGLVTMLQICAANLREITGMKGAAVGDSAKPNEPYQALLDQQRRGDNATYHYGDNLSRGIGYCGRILEDLIPHVYNTRRQLLIVDPDGKTTREVLVNQQMPSGQDPSQMQVLNSLLEGRFEVVIESGPSYATRRVEAASEMQEFMGAMGPQTATLIGDLFAEMADWPGDVGTKIAARLHAMLPPQIQQMEADPNADPQVAQMQAALQGMQQQMQQMQGQAQAAIGKLTADNATLKSQLELARVDVAKAELKAANQQSDNAIKMADILTEQKDTVMRAEGQRRSDDIELIGKRMDAMVKILTLVSKAQEAAGGLPAGADLDQLNAELQRTIEAPVEPDIAGGPHVRTGHQAGATGGSTADSDARALAAAVMAMHERMNMLHDHVSGVHDRLDQMGAPPPRGNGALAPVPVTPVMAPAAPAPMGPGDAA
jgi:hypothetical protein